MTAPSVKTAFSNDKLGNLLSNLYSTGHNVQWDLNGERPKLIIHGDLNNDIVGFDVDLEVRGDLCSSVDISGDLKTGHVKTLGNKTVSANNLTMETLSNINGDGIVNIRGNISGNMYSIYGENNGLTLNCSGDVKCSRVNNNAKIIIDGKLLVSQGIEANGVETHITAGYIKTNSISGNKALVFSATDIHVTYAVSGGAKAFALGEIKAQSIGCPKGHGTGTDGRTMAYSEKQIDTRLSFYNADCLAPKYSEKDVHNMYVATRQSEGYKWPEEPNPSSITTEISNADERMFDLIRLGYSTMAKHGNAPMPELVSHEIHRRFTPA